MTTTRVYKSTDGSAPVLDGTVGSLINLLDKCLVTGYGAQTAAGWTKPYTGTNKAAFRNSIAAGGTGMHFRVDDNSPGTGGAREAFARAYMTMSDVDTGTFETPTVAQISTGVVWRKSNTLDATARSWIIVADERTFYLWVDSGTSSNGNSIYAAGDYESHIAGEAYPFFISGRNSQGGASLNSGISVDSSIVGAVPYTFATPAAHGVWVPRGYSGSGNPVMTGIMCPTVAGYGYIVGSASAGINDPSPGSSLIYYIPAFLCGESTVRGRLRGCYIPLNKRVGQAAGTEVVNPPGLTGTLVSLRHYAFQYGNTTTGDGYAYIDKTNEWP